MGNTQHRAIVEGVRQNKVNQKIEKKVRAKEVKGYTKNNSAGLAAKVAISALAECIGAED